MREHAIERKHANFLASTYCSKGACGVFVLVPFLYSCTLLASHFLLLCNPNFLTLDKIIPRYIPCSHNKSKNDMCEHVALTFVTLYTLHIFF
jgi:hypothetical protein